MWRVERLCTENNAEYTRKNECLKLRSNEAYLVRNDPNAIKVREWKKARSFLVSMIVGANMLKKVSKNGRNIGEKGESEPNTCNIRSFLVSLARWLSGDLKVLHQLHHRPRSIFYGNFPYAE